MGSSTIGTSSTLSFIFHVHFNFTRDAPRADGSPLRIVVILGIAGPVPHQVDRLPGGAFVAKLSASVNRCATIRIIAPSAGSSSPAIAARRSIARLTAPASPAGRRARGWRTAARRRWRSSATAGPRARSDGDFELAQVISEFEERVERQVGGGHGSIFYLIAAALQGKPRLAARLIAKIIGDPDLRRIDASQNPEAANVAAGTCPWIVDDAARW